jgi:hypothetical protein
MGILRAAAAAAIAVQQHALAAVVAVHIGVHYAHNTIRSILHGSYMELDSST